MAAEDILLQQVHGVSGQKLIERGAKPADEGVAFRHLGDQRGENQGGGKEHEHAGIGDSLGRIDHVVSKGVAEGYAEIHEEGFHARHWQD